jgi:hypothetical protein
MQDSKDDFDDDAPSGRRVDLDGADDGEGLGIGTPHDYAPGSSQSLRRRGAREVEVNVWEEDQSGVDFAVRLVSHLELAAVPAPSHCRVCKPARHLLVTCSTSPRKKR